MTGRNTASSRIRIDKTNLVKNYQFLNERSATARAAPVIKANGYGAHVQSIIECLDGQDIPFYFVATLEEGIMARRYTSRPIAILNGLFHDAEDAYITHNLTPICGSISDIQRWQKFDAPYIWQIDTGMNRLGVRYDECDELLALNTKKPALILSHFISSEEPNNPLNQTQIDRFEKVRAQITAHYGDDIDFSMANSSGIFLPQKPLYDITRPGLALYGANPTPDKLNPMLPVISYDARVLRISHAKAGESAGYNATYTFPHDATIATISLGYADGIPRHLSGHLNLYWNGQACPVRGRISMDLMIVDISHLSADKPQIGDFLELIGPHQSLDDFAKSAGTISYEILTSLSQRADVIVI